MPRSAQLIRKIIGAFKSFIAQTAWGMLPDYLYVRLTYLRSHGSLPNLKRQSKYNERITYRLLHPLPIFAELTDKYLVRSYVEARVGPHVLVPLYAVAEQAENLDFRNLPSPYILKAAHGCNWFEIVRDNNTVDDGALRRMAREWLSKNYYETSRERHYRSLRPKIIAEKLLLDRDGSIPKDYKIHCFRKDRKLTQIIEVHSNRFVNHNINYFTADWTVVQAGRIRPRASGDLVQAPDRLREMLSVADRLSEPFNYVRVDLYNIHGEIYFGELTFTPTAGLNGLYPHNLEEEWANLFEDDRSYYGGFPLMHGAAQPAPPGALSRKPLR